MRCITQAMKLKTISNITCITLSKTPFVRTDLPDGMEYLNYVSDFKESITNLHSAWLTAVSMVRTEGFIFVDSDDPFPKGVRLPKDKALLIGNELTFNFLHNKSRYGLKEFITKPTAIHKAVGITSIVKKIIPYIPKGHYLTEWMVYSTMITMNGFEHSNEFVYVWKKTIGKGMHMHTGGTYQPTKYWIENEMPKVIEMISK